MKRTMLKFLIGLTLGASLSFAFAQTTTREIDCPPGGKITMMWKEGGGGGSSSESKGSSGVTIKYTPNSPRSANDPGEDYDCVAGASGGGIGVCTAYKKREQRNNVLLYSGQCVTNLANSSFNEVCAK
jgi:hypothetical protein